MTVDDLKTGLAGLVYPCYFIVHGPAREHRTTYRAEHGGAFASGMVWDAAGAFAMFARARYLGNLSEMDLIAISIEDGRLNETLL